MTARFFRAAVGIAILLAHGVAEFAPLSDKTAHRLGAAVFAAECVRYLLAPGSVLASSPAVPRVIIPPSGRKARKMRSTSGLWD
jgi:hypothetical protein